MIEEDLFDQIEQALDDRQEWESRHTTYYQMRHRGLPRLSKPYPNAPNQHLPLADTMIEKLKPYYVQQLYGNETFTTFLSLESQWTSVASAASDWFDFQLKQNSNFEEEIQIGIDKMLESAGFAVIKIFWDADGNYLCFDACDPLHIIVPDWTKEIEHADWLVHILHYSEAKYKSNSLFNKDEEFIKRIKGKGAESSGENQKESARTSREGLTYGKDDQIVVWEVFHKDCESDDKKWVIDTVSPLLGATEENQIRPGFGLPFRHGKLPFRKIRTEIIDKGFYSPRSLTAVVAPFESYGCKVWNSKVQWMDFFNNPTYDQDPHYPLPNTQNHQRVPGGINPPGLRASETPHPPLSFDEEMNQTRLLAEYRVSLPDFGVVQPNVGARPSSRRTATEISAIVGQSGQGNDIRGRTFRKDLGGIFQMAWDVICQYCKTSDPRNFSSYLVKEQIRELPPEALMGKYLIIPNGSPDSWNKPAQLAKATAILQMIGQTPMAQYFAWDEGLQWLFELEDPRLVKRLYRDPQIGSQKQGTKQHEEILLMQARFGVIPEPSDDDKVHLAALLEYFQGLWQEIQMGQAQPPGPVEAKLLSEHVIAHLQALAQKKDPALQQIQKAFVPFLAILQQIASQPPPNIVPLQQQPAVGGVTSASPPPSLGPPGAAAPPSPQETADKKADIAIKAGNMLTSAVKAGVPVSIADYDVLFRALGLPLMPNPTEVINPPQPEQQQGQEQQG